MSTFTLFSLGKVAHIPRPITANAADLERRRISTLFGLAAIATAAVTTGHWYHQRALIELALRTHEAQTLTHTLADGSVLDLASHTDIVYAEHHLGRVVRIREGEVRFTVRPDAQRPFYVETNWGRLRVADAAFTVSARNGRMDVAVDKGRVSVWTRQNSPAFAMSLDVHDTPVINLDPGDTIQADLQGLHQRKPIHLAEWRTPTEK